MIAIISLTKQYGDTDFSLEIHDLSFPDSGLFLVTGASGCGKTTLLDLIAGLKEPDSGTILFDGKKVCCDENFYRNSLTYVRVENNVFNGLTARDNLLLAASNRQEALKMADAFTLEESEKASKLSKGESERLALACGILKNTPILLSDEPTANLDDDNAQIVIQKLKEFSKDHLVLVASHDLELFENCADGKIVLKHGKIVENNIKKEDGKAKNEKQIEVNRIKKPLLSLSVHKALSNKAAYFSTAVLLFVAFFFGFFGFNYFGFDAKGSLASALEDKKTYVCHTNSLIDEDMIPCLAANNDQDGKYAIYLDEDIRDLYGALPSFSDTEDNGDSIPILIDSAIRDQIRDKGLSSDVGSSFPLGRNDYEFVIAGYFDSGDFSSYPTAIASSSAYREYLRQNVSLFQGGNLSDTIDDFYDSIGVEENKRDTYFSSDLKDCRNYTFFPSRSEAEENFYATGEKSYYLLGRLPKNENEIVVDNSCLEQYFFGADNAIGNAFLKEEGLSLVLDLVTPTNAFQKTETYSLTIVGCYGVIDDEAAWTLPSLVQKVVLEKISSELFSLRVGFSETSYPLSYLLDNEKEVLDGKIDIDGFYVQNIFPFIQGQARTMWIVLSLSFFGIAILIALLYLITIEKDLRREETLLILWGFRKKDRLFLYLCSILAIAFPSFLLSAILSPSLFQPVVQAIYSFFPGSLLFSYLYGFLALFLSFLFVVLVFLLPLLLPRRKKHDHSH